MSTGSFYRRLIRDPSCFAGFIFTIVAPSLYAIKDFEEFTRSYRFAAHYAVFSPVFSTILGQLPVEKVSGIALAADTNHRIRS